MDTITSKLDAEHKVWLDQIRAWEREIDVMAGVNGEIVAGATTTDSRKQVEHFENQFSIQKKRLDDMKHNIKLYGGDLEKGAKDIEDYRGYFNELKEEFDSFKQASL